MNNKDFKCPPPNYEELYYKDHSSSHILKERAQSIQVQRKIEIGGSKTLSVILIGLFNNSFSINLDSLK